VNMKSGKINELSIANHAYVLPLTHIPIPPKTLYIKGRLPSKRRPTVAIIGSRKPTAYGIEITRQLASELARHGSIVISGLAYGIDAVAHKAALEVGGTTIAILANGLHRVYPATHKNLADEIIEKGGALISEHPPGVEAMRHHFLARNRLISGLADAIIVTEATERSGTLSTVAHALEQGKDVFAVPGPVTSLLSAGPNRLIQQGAHVALTAQDILAVVAPQIQPQQSSLHFGSTPDEARIITLIQKGIRDGDALQKALGLPITQVLQSLTILELNGVIYNLGANQWALR
jgi:DNA processing protein